MKVKNGDGDAPPARPLNESAPQSSAANSTASWAESVIERGRAEGCVPRYGTPEFEALPYGSWRRSASIVAAAECWRRDGTDEAVEARLRAELNEADLMFRYRLAEGSRDVSEAFNELIEERGYVVPFAELQRRRNEMLGAS